MLRVRNRKNGVEYDTTRDEFESLIVSQGLSHMYEVLEDGAPMEIKAMRAKKLEAIPEVTTPGKLTEVNLEVKKTNKK